MKQVNKKKFLDLVAKRKELAAKNSNKIVKVSAQDSQLKNIIDSFNESKQYKKM